MARELLPIQVGDIWLALDAGYVQEILGQRPWVAIPGARALVPGVLAWQGRAVALVDLAVALAAGSPLGADDVRRRTVIVKAGAITCALPVDAVREVQEVADDQLRAPHAVERRFVVFEVDLLGAAAAVIDLAAIVGAAGPAAA